MKMHGRAVKKSVSIPRGIMVSLSVCCVAQKESLRNTTHLLFNVPFCLRSVTLIPTYSFTSYRNNTFDLRLSDSRLCDLCLVFHEEKKGLA
jgi:hypothetical protein